MMPRLPIPMDDLLGHQNGDEWRVSFLDVRFGRRITVQAYQRGEAVYVAPLGAAKSDPVWARVL